MFHRTVVFFAGFYGGENDGRVSAKDNTEKRKKNSLQMKYSTQSGIAATTTTRPCPLGDLFFGHNFLLRQIYSSPFPSFMLNADADAGQACFSLATASFIY